MAKETPDRLLHSQASLRSAVEVAKERTHLVYREAAAAAAVKILATGAVHQIQLAQQLNQVNHSRQIAQITVIRVPSEDTTVHSAVQVEVVQGV